MPSDHFQRTCTAELVFPHYKSTGEPILSALRAVIAAVRDICVCLKQV